MATESLDHCTYIIRVWKEVATHAGDQPWRIVLITSDSMRRQGFVEVEELLKALQSELTKIIQEAPA